MFSCLKGSSKCTCWVVFILTLFSFVHSTGPLPRCRSMWTLFLFCASTLWAPTAGAHIPLTRAVILSWPGNDPHDALWLHENKHSEHINPQLSFSPSEHSQQNCMDSGSELCSSILTFTYIGKTKTMTPLCMLCTCVHVHFENFSFSSL